MKNSAAAARSLKDARLLIVGWKTHCGEFLREMLSTLGRPSFSRASSTDEALILLQEQGFELVLCTDKAAPLSAAAFTRALRRDPYSRDPTIPVVIVAAGCSLAEIVTLRGAGADDIICPPMSADAIEKRLSRVLLRPRKFVACKTFIGPDRRRGGERSFEGGDRRSPGPGISMPLPPVVRE